MSKEQARRCARCGETIVLDANAWRLVEKAARHGSGCGGRFPEPAKLAEMKRRSG